MTVPGLSLALGGGGARGFAHIGVLRVLEQEGIPVRAIAGTSAGALIGALRASGARVAELEALALRMRRRRLFRLLPLSPRSLLSDRGVRALLAPLLSGRRIEDLPIPLAIHTADLRSGEAVVLREGDLLEAVLATVAVPGFFPPVAWGPWALVDGGILSNVPVRAARALSGRPVVAVDLGFVGRRRRRYDASLLRIGERALDLLGRSAALRDLEAADLVLRPDVFGLSVRDWHRGGEFMAAGAAEARARLDALRGLAGRTE